MGTRDKNSKTRVRPADRLSQTCFSLYVQVHVLKLSSVPPCGPNAPGMPVTPQCCNQVDQRSCVSGIEKSKSECISPLFLMTPNRVNQDKRNVTYGHMMQRCCNAGDGAHTAIICKMLPPYTHHSCSVSLTRVCTTESNNPTHTSAHINS